MGTFAFTKEEFTRIQDTISKNLDLEENFEVYDRLFDEKAASQIEYLHKNGMEALFKLNRVNYQIFKNFQAHLDGKFPSLYDASVDLSKDEVYQLITSKELYERVLKIDAYSKRGISRDCAEAIVGTVLTTVGAIAVGGPVGLGLWLVTKGYNTYQLIRACR